MKRNTLRAISVALALILCVSTMSLPAQARASYYIDSTYASATKTAAGELTIGFDITGTGRMTEIGATKIEIKSSSGLTVRTYKSIDAGYEYMMGSNRTFYANSITHSGTIGSSYYAIVYYKAANSSGSDTTTYTTPLIKV